ncbi:serine/threonine-protein kinase [Paramecium bursaria Chlorella virus CVM-1]|uniref:mitogen-activated protein kinase kinase n=1 Tax=Paramecium bursaria Chlorella virus CVA-1 TaxID=42683 RepID=M1GXZ5_9PHYC|nr:serine-threonine kinase [Paramecium bursaria Chlorella virus CVA-1]AGE50443.1 serine/threonine-protein kinase [Paramecium bursaria Chlorella virus CVA-1]AGE51785.1 serine/threonine-protein kinase [Paramecium bursaria Chlorella virus CVM-1]AGE52122.1 serine/threonine-protein kinase [Paramecium bursaria Chlorella virus CVR-1]
MYECCLTQDSLCLYLLSQQTKNQTIKQSNNQSNTMGICFSSDNSDVVLPAMEVVKKPHWKESNVFVDYDFIKKIGRGGNSEVWMATEKSSGMTVAIKASLEDPETRDELVKEFVMYKNFDSPNVLKPRCFYYTKSLTFMVMELYDNDLFTSIETIEYFDDSLLRKIVHEIASGIKIIHDKDIVHRDIKPENIMIGDDGCCIVGDFGAAEHVDKITLTRLIGTTKFMAPEIVTGFFKPERSSFVVGKPIDVYALGQLLYLAITKMHAIPSVKNSSVWEMQKVVDVDMMPLIDDLDRSECLKDLLYGMLDPNPVQRFTIEEVLAHDFVKNSMF